MSITSDGIWAASPSTTRGSPTVISSDSKGERIAYASNKSVFVRSIDHPDEARQFTAATTLTIARFAPSGAYIAVGDAAGTVRIWDCLGEGNLKGEYSITSGPINDIAWDGDSARIIAVGNGKQRFGHCITADSGNSVGEISGHGQAINCVAIRQQRPLRAATGSDDLSMVFYHGAPFKFASSQRGKHSRYIYGTGFSPDGALLVTVGADRKVWVYDGKTGEAIKSIGEGEGEAHTGSIFGVAWAKDSKRIATCSADQTIRVWDVDTGKPVQMWRMGEQGSVDIAHHQVGITWARDNLIISVDLDGNLNYFTLDNTTGPTRIVRGHQKTVTAACMGVADGKPIFWTGSYDGKVLAWDPAAGLAEVTDEQTHSNRVSALSAADDGRVYSTGWDDSLRTLDAGTKAVVGDVVKTQGQPRDMATTSVDGKTLTLVVSDEGLNVYSDGKQVTSQKTAAQPTCIAARNDIVAVGCEDSSVQLYTISGSSLSLIKSIKPSSAVPSVLALSHKSNLAIGLANGKIIVYAVSTSDATEVTDRWSAHTARVGCIAWSPDGKFAASGGIDTHVHVWSVEDPGKRIKFANAHKDLVAGVGWVDSCTLLSAGGDAAVRRWKVAV